MIRPGLDLAKEYNKDHIFPKSRFTEEKLRDAGIEPERIGAYLDSYDRLPNLQLLEDTPNREKHSKLPDGWIKTFPSEDRRKTYLEENDLDGLPLGLADFMSFFDQRKQRMRTRLLTALGIKQETQDEVPSA